MSATNPEFLLELVGGDRAAARDILGEFLASDAQDRASLVAATQAANVPEVHSHAHRIKGAARAIGANDYAEAASAVELAAAIGNDLEGAIAQLEAASLMVARWRDELE